MDTPDSLGEQDVAAAVAKLKEQLETLGRTTDVINFERIESTTGIPVDVVKRLFAGEAVAREEYDLSFQQRLQFLRRTRLREDGKEYSAIDIARAIGVSKPTITALLRGDRNPSLEVSASLARFFRVQSAFFTIDGGEALLNELKPVAEQASWLAEFRGVKLEHLALRGTIPSGSDDLAQDLREAMRRAMDPPPPTADGQPEDSELREFTNTMRSLPASRRRSVMDVVRGVLGLANGDSPEGADQPVK